MKKIANQNQATSSPIKNIPVKDLIQANQDTTLGDNLRNLDGSIINRHVILLEKTSSEIVFYNKQGTSIILYRATGNSLKEFSLSTSALRMAASFL